MSSPSHRGAALALRFVPIVAAAAVLATGTRVRAACDDAPRATCVAPITASVVIKESTPGRERLKLAFRSMASDVGPADLGDPAGGTTTYDVCLYDDTAALAGALTLDRGSQLCAGGKPCWRALAAGYRYRDVDAAANGVQKMLIEGGRAGQGKLSIRAGNRSGKQQTAMPIGLTAGLAGSGSATVQITASDGACFGLTLTRVLRAETTLFAASGSVLTSVQPTTPVPSTTSTTRPPTTSTSTSTSRPTTTSTSTTTTRPPTTSTSTSTSRPTTTSTSTTTTRPPTTSTSTSTSRPSTTSTSTTTTRPPTTSTSTSTSRPSTTSTSTTVPGSSTWARRLGASTSDAGDTVAVDGAGNVFVGGTFRGPVDFGGVSLASAGGSDGFIAKYSPTGTLRWARALGGALDDAVVSVAPDGTGDVVVAGRLAGAASLGGTLLVTAGPGDIFLAKYAGADGAHRWSKRFGGIYEDAPGAVATDDDGNVVLTGYFRGTVDFGSGTLRVPFDTDLDVFVAKFTGAGAPSWSKNFPNTGNDRGYGIAVDAAGNIAVAGTFSNTIDLGGSDLSSANAMIDAFVVKLDAGGTHLWSRQLGTPSSNEGANAIAVDGSGNVLVTGYAIAGVDLGGGLLPPFGGTDAFVAKYTAAAGAHLWSRRFGGTGNDYGNGLAVDAAGNVAVAGAFEGTAGFGGASLTAVGTNDAYVAKLTAAGGPGWARRLGGQSSDVGRALAFTPDGRPVTIGYFYDSGLFGSTTLVSGGMADAFVASLAP